MYENSATYTWWDIEDGVGPLATQAVDRWEAHGRPKEALGAPAVLRVWPTGEGKVTYTIGLFYGGFEVYTAEGAISISGVSRRVATDATIKSITESASDIVGDSVAEKLTRGLSEWLCQQ